MYRMTRTLLAVCFAGLLTLPALAQPVKYGQAGMTFLKLDVSARAAGMASAKAGITGDVAAMFANPAGLAFVDGVEALTSVTDWIVDTKHYGVGVAYGAGTLGTFGVNVVWMDYGELRRTIPYEGSDPEMRNQGYVDQGTFNVSEYAVGVSYARQITTKFYIGGNLRYAAQNLGSVMIFDDFDGTNVEVENELSNIVFDFGTLYYTGFKDLRLGAAFRNFSNQSDYLNQRFELPLSFEFGVAMDLLTLSPALAAPGRNTLTLAIDWTHPRDYSERLHMGLEYGFLDTVFLRGGYKFNYDEEGFAAGLGVNLGIGDAGLKADYAYSATGALFDTVHRITLGVRMR